MDGALDEVGVIAGDGELCALGENIAHLADGRAHAVRDRQRVGLRLPHDAETNAGLPLERSAVCPVSGPSVTEATSRRRILVPIKRFSKSSGVWRSAVARTVMSWLVLVIEPAGTSKEAVASAVRRFATVSPRPASLA